MKNHLTSVVLLFLLAGPIVAVGAAQPAKVDGTWAIQSIIRDPREKGTGEGAGFHVKISGEHITVADANGAVLGAFLIRTHHPKQGPDQADFWVDESAFGKSVDQILREPPVLAIYERNGDQLKVCWAPLEQRKRPTELESRPGSNRSLVVLKRSE